jgi:acyl-CoA thioesterase II
MDARSWLGLEPTHNPYRWVLPVTPAVSTHGGFLFGGCGLGAAIEALEGTTGRPVIWATAQYLSYASAPSVLDIDVTVAVSGRNTTQARAVGHVADREIFTVNAALGRRDAEAEGQWEAMPQVPPPGDSPPRRVRIPEDDRQTLMQRLETRIARGRDLAQLDGMPGDGSVVLWARLPEVLDMSAAALGILGDYVPFGISQALGVMGGGNSLDNTLRVARVVPTKWVLLDIKVHAIHNGFGHGIVHLFAEDGTLMATASQSTIVRHWPLEDIEKMRLEIEGNDPAQDDEEEAVT